MTSRPGCSSTHALARAHNSPLTKIDFHLSKVETRPEIYIYIYICVRRRAFVPCFCARHGLWKLCSCPNRPIKHAHACTYIYIYTTYARRRQETVTRSKNTRVRTRNGQRRRPHGISDAVRSIRTIVTGSLFLKKKKKTKLKRKTLKWK